MSGPGVRCAMVRGGSSKGLFFEAADLPADEGTRDELLLALMGSPDPRQIDGLGGAHPLTSKVAIVGPSGGDRAELDYLFLQLDVDGRGVSDRQNCGNLLAGVAPFALARGVIERSDGPTEVRILMRNTDAVATARFGVTDGRYDDRGDTRVSGVPGSAGSIRLDFDGIAGSSCGALLPTGSARDTIDGVDVTLVDHGMPVVVMRADALGVDGDEPPPVLEADDELRRRLASIRLAAGPMMNLGDVAATTVPKLALVSPPRQGGDLCTRSFIPHRCHEAVGVLAAVSIATAARLPESPAHEVAVRREAGPSVLLEHPTGTFEAAVDVTTDDAGEPVVGRAGIVRTARILMDGRAYPRSYR